MSSTPTKPARSRSRPRHLAFSIHSTIFLSLLSLRILNALTVRTFFQPDEYFQSLEPAWNLVFGDGWLTWEWRHQLRSIAHPMIFASLYKAIASLSALLSVSPATQANALNLAPRLLQALFAAMGDWATARLAGRLWGSDVGWLSLWISLGSAWGWFCGTRTFANSLETVVTALALSMWPWTWAAGEKRGPRQDRAELRSALALAAFACVLRPTNLLVWAFLGAFAVWNCGSVARARVLVGEAAWIGIAIFSANALLDRAYYGAWTFPPLTFLAFNVLQSLSVFYGANPWHYYISQGLPMLLTSFLPLALYALFRSIRLPATNPAFQLAATVLGVTTLYSVIAHKEARFLYPLLPALHALAAKTLNELQWSKKAKMRALAAMVFVNLPIAYYTTLVHQRGVVDVLEHVGDGTVGFLMPCHSTPWKSSVGGGNAEWWALGCEPPIDVAREDRAAYQDEADVFYSAPRTWVQDNVGAGKKREWPDRLVVFQSLLERDGLVWGDGYEQCWRGFNTHWIDDWRREGDVVVFCRKDGEKLVDVDTEAVDWEVKKAVEEGRGIAEEVPARR